MDSSAPGAGEGRCHLVSLQPSPTGLRVAGGGAFTTPGVKQAADSAVLGTSLNVAGPDGVSFSVKYDAELKDKYASHTGVLEARINF